MKKKYIKPQSKVIAVKLMGLIAASPIRSELKPLNRGTNVMDSREGNFYDDDDDE